MKQINDLIVVEVPKDAKNIRIQDGWLKYLNNLGINMNSYLPPGNYEIIGVYGQINHIQMNDAYKSAGKDLSVSIWNWLDMPTDTSDLLFIKKTK